MKVYSIAFLLCLLAGPLRAQYTWSGRIEYERKVNLHKLWDGDQWMERWKDKAPTFMINYFNLAFTSSQSRYAPGREVEAPKMAWGLPPVLTMKYCRTMRIIQ